MSFTRKHIRHSRALSRIFGRRYGHVPTIKLSRALDRIRRGELRPDFLSAMLELDRFIVQESRR